MSTTKLVVFNNHFSPEERELLFQNYKLKLRGNEDPELDPALTSDCRDEDNAAAESAEQLEHDWINFGAIIVAIRAGSDSALYHDLLARRKASSRRLGQRILIKKVYFFDETPSGGPGWLGGNATALSGATNPSA